MSFSGDLYPTAGASTVMSTKGDMVDFDTIRQRLAIGSANQILQVKSNLPSWETVPLADTVLTTAGDVLYEDATPALARLGAGTQYNTLQMGATLPAWQPSATSVMSTTGDLLYASSANTLARLAGGTSGDVLTANGAGVAPTYQTPSGGGIWTGNGTDTNTSLGSNLNVSLSNDPDLIQVLFNVSGQSGSPNVRTSFTVNDDTGGYESRWFGFYNSFDYDAVTGDIAYIDRETHTQSSSGMINIFKANAYVVGNSGFSWRSQSTRGDSADEDNYITMAGGGCNSITGAITSFEMMMAENDGTEQDIVGSIQVNSMVYQ